MNSLTTGEWGSFTAPRSRALGGKSGMTRAKPLVLIFSARQRPAPLHFADSLRLLFLVLLGASLTYASPPPYGRPQLFPYAQEEPCKREQEERITHPENWIERNECEPST